MNGHERTGDSWLRPQAAAFILLAEHVAPRRVALWSGSFIDVFDRLGITEHATRATLSRMTQRGLLVRHRRGRRAYFSPTRRCLDVLDGGARRIWRLGAVNNDPETPWTILTFSLPEAQQRDRHDLRSRLTWAGLGSLHPGVWIGPAAPEVVAALTDELGLDGRVHVFPVAPAPVTDLAGVASQAFDLDALAAGYERFIADWRDCPQDAPGDDPLALTVRLTAEWLEVLRQDPRIPVPLLPPAWPAVTAQELFRTLHAANYPAATAEATELFDTVEPGAGA